MRRLLSPIARLMGALWSNWLPIVVGAAWGAAVAFVALATLLVWLESSRVRDGVLLTSRQYDFADFGMAAAALVLGLAQGGAIYGYITRRERT